MNYKIIETDELSPDVLLYRNRDKYGEESVVIMAIGTIDNSEDSFAIETISFEKFETAQEFIKNATTEFANNWCKIQDVEY